MHRCPTCRYRFEDAPALAAHTDGGCTDTPDLAPFADHHDDAGHHVAPDPDEEGMHRCHTCGIDLPPA